MADTANTNTELQSILDRMATLEEGYSSLTKENSALKSQLEKQSTPMDMQEPEKFTIPTETYSVGRRKFKFKVARAIIAGKTMTALDIAADEKLMEGLVYSESEVLTEVF